MAHAWLDSLSEDWVSQPASDASFADAAPSPSSPSPDPKPKPRTPVASRIPRLSPRPKKPQTPADANSSSVLSERSTNERLAHASRRTPSKLSRELSLGSGRDCQACRSASTSNPNSVVRSTLHRKSASASSAKAKGETPEWKRRLVYGDLSYGEQRDLFTSAGTGLENIFKPPQPTPHPKKYAKADASYREGQSQLDVTLPPSPPLHRRDPSTVEIHLDESRQEQSQQLPQRAPMSVRYRRTEESADASRQSELSVDPASRSQAASMTEQTALSDGPSGESRKVSGQSVLRNEDFSPILLERRKASNGKTTFCPAELPPDELRKRLEKLRRNQMLLVSEGDESAAERRPANPAKSGNMEATEDLDRRGGFINFQRGGRSEEGSFRNRMLSSALNDSSELHPEESLQASTPKQFPTVRVERHEKSERIPADSPDLPRAPNPSPEKKPAPMPASTGSPLKLFQPYDTFTNQTLLRRLSQIHEEASDSSFSMVQDGARKHGLPSECSSVFLPPAARNRGVSRPSASANRFGAGELDGYEFNDEFSHMSNDASGMERDKENGRPGRDSALRPHPPIFDLSHNSSPSEPADLVVHRRRQKSTTSHPPRRSGRASFPAYGDMLSTPRRRRDITGSEIKRPRTSPSKDPTPKRRRTLHKSDVSYGTEGHAAAVDSVQLSHQQMQSAVGGLQPNMHEIGRQELPEPDLAGARQALRPRTPTPSQRSSLQRDRQPLAENERPPTRSSKRFQPPPALPVGSATETHRKPSIKTEDFINEANKIMAMIRSKAGLRSGLASLEESDEERGRPSPDLEGSFEESTQEPFSRPPSREGRPPLTRMSTKQEDPVLAERLKKYEEASDMGDMITASVRSTALSQAALSAAAEGGSVSKNVQSSHGSRATVSDADVVSDPPNLRLSRNPEWQEWQGGNGLHDGVPSQGSTGPPTQNTAMSIPTGSSRGSSRGSEARKTIAPESVLHLIPDQVGNMVLDRERNIWIKRKLSAESAGPSRSFVQSEASEDDPFAGIPDLTVDMTLEMRNLRLLTGKKPASRDGVPGVAADISPSKPPRGGSVRESALVNGVVESAESRIHKQCPKPGMTGEAVEHEISINEDRASEPRRLTISFSSPIASVIQDVAGHHDVDSEDVSVLDGAPENLRQELRTRGRRIISIHASTKNKSAQSQSHSHGPPRHFPVKGQAFIARPVSRIDERDEDSVQGRGEYQEAASGMELSVLGDYSVVSRGADRGQRASLSFLVATPARPQGCPVAEVDAGPIISQYVGTFSLSPMSDFTMHRAEESLPLEASYVVGNHRLVTGDRTRRVVSASVRDLVAKLAEVEPFEPYWEDMRELELRDKGLNAVHALDEFCGQLESLDVSRNNIRNLSGVPSSVRRLRVTDNQLSSLTAWSHLMNLQYVDVSNNGLTSLAPFKSLIHLRSLRADNNQITSLDGIKFHKGLQTLRVRGNAIEEVDFDASTLEQLTELDLKDNKIRRVANLGRLPALNSLNLEGNQLESFALESEQPMNSLRYLRLDDNKLSALDVKKLPHLRLLHADRNYLVRIWGFSRARRIDSLSLREQRGATPLDLPHLLSRAYEVRKLYLSGNLVESFAPPVDLLNLQLLELANCGLTALPRHLGLALPNLRVLNLNLNALADLRPLRAVPRLKRLLAAGNRLADPAALVAVLARFRHMAVVDLRDNPLTQGFYAPMAAQQVVVMHHRHDRDRQQQHHHRCGAGTREEEQQQRDEDRRGDSGGEGFSLPDQDGARDGAYCGRLDMDTRVRRRLYEVLVRERCARVRRLDGLPVVGRRQGVGEGKGKPASGGGEEGQEKKEEEEEEEDVVWLAMAEKGLVVVRARGEGEDEEDGKVASEADRSARWPAEDSFA